MTSRDAEVVRRVLQRRREQSLPANEPQRPAARHEPVAVVVGRGGPSPGPRHASSPKFLLSAGGLQDEHSRTSPRIRAIGRRAAIRFGEVSTDVAAPVASSAGETDRCQNGDRAFL